jgi:hypothetical protein
VSPDVGGFWRVLLMGYPLSLGIFGGLAVAGVGTGIYLGQAAIAEIDPMYFEKPPTRFHADLSPYRPSDSARRSMLASAEEPSLGTACVGCRTYPEEYRPIRDASIDRDERSYAADVRATVAETAVMTQEVDPEADRLRRDIDRVARYAQGSAPASLQLASVEAEAPADSQAEELPTLE